MPWHLCSVASVSITRRESCSAIHQLSYPTTSLQLLDYDANCAPTDRHRLFKALLRLSANSELYPRCFTLTDLGHEKLVAGGSFSDVYMGHLGGQCVGVKMMRVFGDSNIDAALKSFGREAIIWRQLSHPNLLPFYGLDKFRQRLCLVSPWMEKGHLGGFLKKEICETDRLLSLILDIALGLKHLHAMGVVHGDLKADNVLVTSSGRACIADFGLASITSSMSSIQFTPPSKASRGGSMRYQAPELHRGGYNDLRSDLYGFACVVYELLAGTVPFSELPSEMAVMFAVLEGRRPSCPPSCSGTPALEGLWALLQDCWHADPETRPTAARVVERLRGDVGASESSIQSESDWDCTSTSRFRRLLLGKQPLPMLVEFENMVSGTGKQSLALKPGSFSFSF
ncbi:kinase-like domain-containing protein [Roridomyces roridus]|uniref:Kinase-like domain-containing protein n=1 Tax=Roridomyces roridus TaxID=1738132 RepID=A0AAD7B8V9_9AGAR|nr:kinase-like domain-containing protein [Roridomyces roridus]